MFLGRKFFTGILAFFVAHVCGDALAAAPVNPRASDSDVSARQSTGAVLSRGTKTAPTRIRAVGQSRTNSNGGRSAKTITAVRVATTPSARTTSTRSAVPVRRARSAKSGPTNARVGKNTVSGINGMARSATARATAVFSDVSKIGSGYAACRESYATCMDQMCANANDTYRRCFCSDRFTKFRNIEDTLDQAMIMLQQFQDNNLNAVDKTAAEVEAMYSATVGELAIKSDTSAAAKALDEINNLLSGKSSSTTSYSGSSNSLGVLDLDFSTDLDDIWSADDASSIFSSSTQDLSTLEGTALFSSAQKQCSNLTKDNCESDAAFSMSRSSYNILITQDCNTYEKTLNKKRETVAQAVRTAEKYLREARLEDYRSHNSADVNECIAKVRTAIFADTACGANYKRCLDPTGAYINGATGEVIYSPRLFKLEETISLSDNVSGDILQENPDYSNFLETYRKYVTQELDTCRDIADFVWTEFKRNAIIEIAQAQTEKIEETKSSCVDTMAECYDTQTNALKNMDKNTATTAAALARYTARDMCAEKVTACAALYGGTNKPGCKFDSRGHLENSASECGLTSLLNYVAAVDSLSVVDRCEKALDEYVSDMCTPDNTSYSYPYNCRNMTESNLRNLIENFATDNCSDPASVSYGSGNYADLDERIKSRVTMLVDDVNEAMSVALAEVCEDEGGIWTQKDDANGVYWSKFYSAVFGGYTPDDAKGEQKYGSGWGYCYQNNPKQACLKYQTLWGDPDVTTWDLATESCVFSDAWYQHKCMELGDGYYIDGVCYIKTE